MSETRHHRAMALERTRTSAQVAGDAAEDLVVAMLARAGWRIIGRNVRVGRAELDIVAIDPGPPRELVVIEVRWRRRRDFGFAEETVDHRKRTRIRRAAYRLVEAGGWPHLSLRFDLVAVEPSRAGVHPNIRHHQAAF